MDVGVVWVCSVVGYIVCIGKVWYVGLGLVYGL